MSVNKASLNLKTATVSWWWSRYGSLHVESYYHPAEGNPEAVYDGRHVIGAHLAKYQNANETERASLLALELFHLLSVWLHKRIVKSPIIEEEKQQALRQLHTQLSKLEEYRRLAYDIYLIHQYVSDALSAHGRYAVVSA